MNKQFKKFFSVILALLIGAGVILFAWKGVSFIGGTVSTEQPGNEWKDALQVIPRNTPGATLRGSQSGTPSEAATTTTDKLARSLLVDYAVTQRGMTTTTWSDTEAEALAQNLIDKIELPRATQYTAKDLNISNDNSDAALVAYGKEVLSIIKPLSVAERVGESKVFNDALTASDVTKLQGLAPIIVEYAQIKNSLLALKTPSGIAPFHLRFTQAFADIAQDITLMQNIFTDPAQGLAAFIQYKKDIVEMGEAGKGYKNYRPATQ